MPLHCSAPSATASAPPQAAVSFASLKGVLFDIDGTLTNSDPLHFRAFQECLAEVGYDDGKPISEEFFRAHISGRHNPEIAHDLFPSWGVERHAEFSETKEQKFRDMAGTVLTPLPGLADFMAWVDSRGLRKGAVTNAPGANTRLMLGALELETYFEVVVLGEECVRAKPFPDPYLEGLRALGLDASHTLVLEDSPAGIKAAVAAGIPVIGLTTGQSADTLFAAGAQHVVGDFTAVMELIAREEAGRGLTHRVT
ncbi:hypothetical protein FOA52_002229 [Chlamydomonas sp. UWO 241]|nr:hypothetical protein FOA52_002229 [Chlamydomonas sp. UWO 241]